jgi:hypothetical protein
VALPDAAHPGRRDRQPRRFSASETRTWPQAGCSIAISTTACSISIGVRFFRIGFLRLERFPVGVNRKEGIPKV